MGWGSVWVSGTSFWHIYCSIFMERIGIHFHTFLEIVIFYLDFYIMKRRWHDFDLQFKIINITIFGHYIFMYWPGSIITLFSSCYSEIWFLAFSEGLFFEGFFCLESSTSRQLFFIHVPCNLTISRKQAEKNHILVINRLPALRFSRDLHLSLAVKAFEIIWNKLITQCYVSSSHHAQFGLTVKHALNW